MKIILTIIFVITAGLFFAFNKQFLSFRTGTTKFIIVKNDFMMRSNILKPNAALLITDKNEIKENEGIFLSNKSFGHACGYHYDIQFWTSNEDLTENIPFNQECEEFLLHNSDIQSRMKSYIKQLETKPTHYIYNLKIPVRTDPNNLLKAFEKSNLNIFFIDGKTNNLATLTLTYMQVSKLKEMKDNSKWDGETNDNRQLAFNKMTSIVNEIKKVTSVKEETEISYPMEGFGQTIEHQAEITLKFAIGTDLSKVKEIIKHKGGEVGNEINPEFYFVQLVDPTDNLEIAKTKLKDFKFISNIFEYPSTE